MTRANPATEAPPFRAGDVVKPSAYAVERDRERMVEYIHGPERSRAEAVYRAHLARRGVVESCAKCATGYGWAAVVKWSDGRTSHSAAYMIDLCDGGAS